MFCVCVCNVKKLQSTIFQRATLCCIMTNKWTLICCFSVFYIIVNWIYLGFELLVGENKHLEMSLGALANCYFCLTFYIKQLIDLSKKGLKDFLLHSTSPAPAHTFHLCIDLLKESTFRSHRPLSRHVLMSNNLNLIIGYSFMFHQI